MSRFIIMMLLVPLLFVQVGCAPLQTTQRKPFAGFPYRHNGFDFRKAWKASQSPQGLAVDGVLKNIRYFRVENLEITVSILRKGEKIFPEETYFFSGSIEREEYRDFALVLKNVTVVPGDLLQFIIRYNALDGTDAFRWTSDFTADPVTGIPVHKAEEMSSDD